MAQSKNSFLSALASSVTSSGTVPTAALAPEVTSSIEGAGTAVYDSASQLPISGNTAGDTAFVKSTSRLYIHSGVGWYNVAVINNTPTVQSITDDSANTTPFALNTDGTPTTITITAQDSDGDPLTYNYSADSTFAGLGTISQANNVFTITPLSEDSATVEESTITFTVTDGINTATPPTQTFTLTFTTMWDYVKFSLQTESGTASDKQTSGTTSITLNGNTVASDQTNLEPNSLKFLDTGSSDAVLISNSTTQPMNFGTGDFTVEFFFYHYWTPSSYDGFWTSGNNSGGLTFGFGSSSQWRFISNVSGYTFNFSGTHSMTYNNWHHFAAVREGTNVRVFVNGTYSNGVTVAAGATFNSMLSNGGFYIGKTLHDNTSLYRLQGWIDSFQVMHYAKYTGTTSFTPPTSRLSSSNP